MDRPIAKKGIIVIFLLYALTLNVSSAAEANSEPSSPYCGLYCVHAAAHALNKPCTFEALVDHTYMNGSYGSTADDLCRALADNSLSGKIVGAMTTNQLWLTDAPVILHVRAPGADTGYRHWILFLGFDGTKVRIYDPPRSVTTVSLEELLSIWDGVGIMTSAPGRVSGAVDLPLIWLPLVALAGLMLWSLHGCRKKAVVLLAVAAAVVVVRHVFLPGGFVGARAALDNIMASHFPSVSEEIDYDQFEKFRKAPDAIVVDARLPSAYRAEHIPGAISVPPALGFSALKDILATVPKDRHVLLYCQSEHCGWSSEVANHFLPRGYRRVSVYRGGMNDWRARQGQRAAIHP